MIRRTIRERTVALRALPPLRDLRLRSEPIRTIATDDRGRHVEAMVSVSAGYARTVDDLDINGDWHMRRQPVFGGYSLTAMLMGDPVPGRSALDQREAQHV